MLIPALALQRASTQLLTVRGPGQSGDHVVLHIGNDAACLEHYKLK